MKQKDKIRKLKRELLKSKLQKSKGIQKKRRPLKKRRKFEMKSLEKALDDVEEKRVKRKASRNWKKSRQLLQNEKQRWKDSLLKSNN